MTSRIRAHLEEALRPLSWDTLATPVAVLGRVAPPMYGPPPGVTVMRHDAPMPRSDEGPTSGKQA